MLVAVFQNNGAACDSRDEDENASVWINGDGIGASRRHNNRGNNPAIPIHSARSIVTVSMEQ